jgi:hypothetical protein
VPECVVVKCDCGEGPVLLTASETGCRCGTDHAAFVREELASRGRRTGHRTLGGRVPGVAQEERVSGFGGHLLARAERH